MNTFLPLVPVLLASPNTEKLHIKPRFIMLVGVPGSGKSTFAESMLDYNTKHITSDGIRKELYGDENCQDDHNRVFNLMYERTLDALKNGYNVVYDATNITRKNRKSILDRLPAYVTKECVIVWAPIDVCIERDSIRERTVGKAVIEKMLRRFEAPFYDEGFDYITVQNTAEYDKDEYTINAVEAINIPNDNPHHTSGSILEHCFL